MGPPPPGSKPRTGPPPPPLRRSRATPPRRADAARCPSWSTAARAASQRPDGVAQPAVHAAGEAGEPGALLGAHRDQRLGRVIGEEAALSLALRRREELPQRM